MGGHANRVFFFMLLVASLYVLTLYHMAPAQPPPPCFSSTTHQSDSHTTLDETDEMIIVLGHKLHSDGMPSRILKDRVSRAVGLYKGMMKAGHHPLIIVSGKGKSDLGYTEAEVMLELSLYMGVREGDVLVDSESTNTAQNAKFTAELIKDNKAINEVYVVTTDYHLPRAQYIFQSIFPTNIMLEFIPSVTAKVQDEKNREKFFMKSSQNDLIQEGVLDGDDKTGDHPLRNFPRWQMISREVENQTTQQKEKGGPAERVVVVEYGSNDGYIAVNLARRFPLGTVISLQGQEILEHEGAPERHEERLREGRIKNNPICRTSISPVIFDSLVGANQVFTYQLSLGVFSWVSPMETREQFENALVQHLKNARTTFLELPEAMQYTPKENEHNGLKVNEWYANRNETQILDDLAAKFKLKIVYKFLGPILHENGTVRKVFRVDLPDQHPNLDVDRAVKLFDCVTLKSGKS